MFISYTLNFPYFWYSGPFQIISMYFADYNNGQENDRLRRKASISVVFRHTR